MDKLIYACHEELDEIWQLFVDAKKIWRHRGSANGQAVTLIRRSSKQISVKQLLIHKNESGEIVSAGTLSPEFFGARRESWV